MTFFPHKCPNTSLLLGCSVCGLLATEKGFFNRFFWCIQTSISSCSSLPFSHSRDLAFSLPTKRGALVIAGSSPRWWWHLGCSPQGHSVGWAGDNVGHSDFKRDSKLLCVVCDPPPPPNSSLAFGRGKKRFHIKCREFDEIV